MAALQQHARAAHCRTHAACRPALHSCRRRAVVAASAPNGEISSAVVAAPPKRLSVLGAVADLCEIQGLTSKFESVAGRSAMLGVSVALAVEVLTEESLLAPLSDGAQAYAGLAALSIVTASAVAVLKSLQLKSTRQPALLEPVITSLTAVRRSAASVTAEDGARKDNSALDHAVDNVLNTMFARVRLDLLTDNSFYVDLE